MHQSYYGGSPAVEEEVTALALRYGLMSQYTSFVAVDGEEAGKSEEFAKPPRRMTIPVPLPDGTRYEGFLGEGEGVVYDLDIAAAVDGGIVLAGKLVDSKREIESLKRVQQSLRGGQEKDFRNGTRNYHRSLGRWDSNQSSPFGIASEEWGAGERASGGDGGAPFGRGTSTRGSAYWFGTVTAASQQPLGELPAVNRLFRQKHSNVLQAVDRTALPSDGIDKAANEFGFEMAYPVQPGSTAGTSAAAQAAWKSATRLLENDDISAETRRAVMQAYLLDVAAANFGHSNGQIADEALAVLEKLHAQQIEAWTKSVPELDKKLNLVLRDRSLSQAIERIADAVGLKIELVAGSEKDVAKLLMSDELRVNYLDLRHATVAQSLDWLLNPARLSWSVTGDGIQIASERRREGQVAWVYDVSLIALPTAKEFSDLKDAAKQSAAINKAIDGFLAATRKDLGIEDEKAVWFAPGQLLIIAGSVKHEAIAKLFDELTTGEFQPRGESGKLATVTRKRAAERKESLDKLLTVRKRLDVASRHNEFGWRLLAAASAGRLDLEALTELQIAWNDTATSDLLAGEASDLALRSLWMVCEAARAMPEEAELKRLADAARKSAGKAVRDTLRTLRDKPDDGRAFTQVLFASLALIEDGDFRAAALDALKNAKTDDLGLTPVKTIITALLAARDEIDRDALAKLVSTGVSGNDLTTLLAMACHRAGGEVWRSFRIAAEDLVAKQPLRGEAVVIINRLASGQLQVARK